MNYDSYTTEDGIEVSLWQDEMSEHANPRHYDNLTVFRFTTSVEGRNRNWLTDKGEDKIYSGEYSDTFEQTCPDCEGSGESIGPENMVNGWLVRPPNCPNCGGVGEVECDIVEYVKASDPNVLAALPVRFEDRGSSGSALYTCDPEDANGVVMVTKASLALTGAPVLDDGDTRNPLVVGMEQDVKVYGQYLNGEVYGWTVNHPAYPAFIESVGGYVGNDDDYVEAEAKDAVEELRGRIAHERAEAANAAARDIPTV